MELYIGGYAQGKLTYVLKNKGILPVVLESGKLGEYLVSEELIFNQFQEWFLKVMRLGENPEEEMDKILKQYPKLIIICNEVGNGIVPAEPFEREYRERLGRYLCRMAKEAKRVERIFCGIGQRIK